MAQVRIRDSGGTLRTASRIRMRDEAGELRTIQRIRVRDASGVLQIVWQNLEANLSTTTADVTGSTGSLVTTSVTATPAGGTGPYTYLWQAAFYNYDNINPTTPTSATTSFRRNLCVSGDTYVGDFYCTITDALGSTAQTGMVTATISRS